MKKDIKYTKIHLLLWSMLAIVFYSVFLSGNTLLEWGDNRTKTILLSLLFIFGFGGDLVLGVMKKKKKDNANRCESDDALQVKILNFTLISVLIYVYVIVIAIYIYYEKARMVPVGWLWFIAYSLILVVNIFSACGKIFFHYKGKE